MYATAYNNLGVLYWHEGNVEKASEFLVKALNIDPDSRDVIINCGRILTSSNNNDDAKKLYSSFLEKNPHDEEISQLLAAL